MPRFIPIQEVIKLPMLANDDYLQRAKGRLLTWAKYVYQDMNMKTLKVAQRQLFDINKRTNTVNLPPSNIGLCSVSVVDDKGVIWPVYKNDKLRIDLVDISAKKDCNCEFNCNHSLCNTIKGYEAITTVKADLRPDGTAISFNCTDRQAVDDKGFLIKIMQYPKRIYTNGVWTSTILQTEVVKLCKVEVDSNGCVCDTPENINAVCVANNIPVGGTAMTPPSSGVNKWIYYSNTQMGWYSVQCGTLPNNCNNIYNISEMGDRLIFPADFGFSKVLVRFYADVNLENIQVPMIAVPTFITGLKWYDHRWNDDVRSQKLAIKYATDFTKQNQALYLELNKYRIDELRMLLNPPVTMPSYIDPRHED